MQQEWVLFCRWQNRQNDYFTVYADTLVEAVGVIIDDNPDKRIHEFKVAYQVLEKDKFKRVNVHFWDANKLTPADEKVLAGLTLKKLNAAIAEKFPDFYLVKHTAPGNSYFALTSDDETKAMLIANLYQSGIYVNAINQMSLSDWLLAVEELLENKKG